MNQNTLFTHHDKQGEYDAGDLLDRSVSRGDDAKEGRLVEGLARLAEQGRAPRDVFRNDVFRPSVDRRCEEDKGNRNPAGHISNFFPTLPESHRDDNTFVFFT